MKKLMMVCSFMLVSLWLQASATINLLWDASPTAGVTYNVYRSATAGGPYTKLNTSPVTATNFTDANAANQVWFYAVRSVTASGLESNNSNELKVDASLPAPPTNLRLSSVAGAAAAKAKAK